MPDHATSTFTVTSWTEEPWDERPGGPKVTRAVVAKAFTGDLEGSSALQYLMAYRDDGSADFVGLERVDGRLAGRSGTFVLRHVGAFIDGAATGSWSIVDGSGTDELEGIRGESQFSLPKGEDAFPFALDYSLPESLLAER